MNRTEQNNRRAAGGHRWLSWPALAGCLAVGLNCLGADSYYINNAIVTYPGTLPYPPQIDATNFVNNSWFTVNFQDYLALSQPFYETSDTYNYTNNGTLMVNTGFNFDTSSSQSGVRTRAANFFNAGDIYCASLADTSDPLFGLASVLGYAQCLVNATNVLIPGTVHVGANGLVKITGNNVDLTRSYINIEGTGANAGGSSAFGLNTNFWNPGADLTGPIDLSGFFPLVPFQLLLTNASSYINVAQGPGGTNIIRAVFIQDDSGSNVAVSVYFDTAGLGAGRGNVTVQWAGSYLDAASANTYSNYLYLNDDYVLGASTNVLPILPGTVPVNFTFTESTTPFNFGLIPPAPSGFPGLLPGGAFFPDGTITNYYDYGALQLLASVSTNSIPNGSITNLPGRVQIYGDGYLNLSNAQITGQSYMSLTSSNEFAGSGGALIQTPYADLNLGNRHGILYVTNVMEGAIPFWGGTCEAWNTRWFYQDATQTNDYRVLLIHSHLTTQIAPQVQNLTLRDYSSNSIVISDTFNVYNSFFADAQSLTLTTNAPGNGATSFDGELNLESPNIFWQSSVPNLRYLTNNGAISMQNLAYFSYPVLTNIVPPIAASGTLTEIGTNVVKKDKVTVGTVQYTFVGTLTNTVANQVLIVPSSFDTTLNNLITAINGGSGAGVLYSLATKSNSLAMAGPLVNHSFTVTAYAGGTSGNTIATAFAPATASVNLSWGGYTKLYGGAPGTTNLVSFLANSALINDGIFLDQGSIVYAGNFESSGVFSNGIGSFTLQSLTTTLTNGAVYAKGDVAITASSILTSNLFLEADRSLTLTVTNFLTDTGPSPTNNSFWLVGSNSVGSGFNLPIKPTVGDLLGTTIHMFAPTNRNVVSTWSGVDMGLSTAGYTNNEAIGQLIFDAANGPVNVNGHNGVFTFNPAGASNAMYVDSLILTNFSTQGNSTNLYNFPWLQINPGMMIYFAQALEDGVSVAEKIDNQSKLGANGGRLRWIPSYTGYFSSTNIIYTNADLTLGTNTVNAALAQSTTIDSDSDGRANVYDPTPFFLPSEVNLMVTPVVNPPNSLKIQWTTIPNATNFIYYATNMTSQTWLPFTNFNNWYYGNNVSVTNSAHGNSFHSPQIYINNASLPDNSQQTNVWLFDTTTNGSHFYKVVVSPWLTFPE